MATRNELANLLFPEVTETIDDLLVKYPPRAEQTVLRIAPSPTGFFHFGNLYMALFDWKYTAQENGVFYLRIEDTDQLRKVEGAVELLLNSLKKF
jgi:glutamyl-tRNA synthetase